MVLGGSGWVLEGLGGSERVQEGQVEYGQVRNGQGGTGRDQEDLGGSGGVRESGMVGERPEWSGRVWEGHITVTSVPFPVTLAMPLTFSHINQV